MSDANTAAAKDYDHEQLMQFGKDAGLSNPAGFISFAKQYVQNPSSVTNFQLQGAALAYAIPGQILQSLDTLLLKADGHRHFHIRAQTPPDETEAKMNLLNYTNQSLIKPFDALIRGFAKTPYRMIWIGEAHSGVCEYWKRSSDVLCKMTDDAHLASPELKIKGSTRVLDAHRGIVRRTESIMQLPSHDDWDQTVRIAVPLGEQRWSSFNTRCMHTQFGHVYDLAFDRITNAADGKTFYQFEIEYVHRLVRSPTLDTAWELSHLQQLVDVVHKAFGGARIEYEPTKKSKWEYLVKKNHD